MHPIPIIFILSFFLRYIFILITGSILDTRGRIDRSNQRDDADAGSKNAGNIVDVDVIYTMESCVRDPDDEISRNGKLAMTQITFLRSMNIH